MTRLGGHSFGDGSATNVKELNSNELQNFYYMGLHVAYLDPP